jgi:hypothetical protein
LEVLAEFVRGNELGGGIAGILYREEPAEGTAREVFAYNPVGHAMALADAWGQITAGRVYAAFGQELGASGASGNNRWSNTKGPDGIAHRSGCSPAVPYPIRDPAVFWE